MNDIANPQVPIIEQTLQRLATQFTVRDIMVPTEKLVKAQTTEEALCRLKEYEDYNLIPLEKENRIIGYVERGDTKKQVIDLASAVGIGSSILDLVDVLADRQFSFVLGVRGIEGYVHFSDLNHHLVNLPFYILLQAVEAHVISLIQGRVNEANLHEVFDKINPKIVQNIMSNYNKNKANDANRSLLNEVNLDKMLTFACHFDLLELKKEEIVELYKVRNSVAHVTEMLIQKHDDVERLVRTKDQCQKILSS